MILADLVIGEAKTDSEIRALWPAIQGLHSIPEDKEQLLKSVRLAQDEDTHFYFAMERDRVIGTVFLVFYRATLLGAGAYIGGMYIEPEYRNTNVFDDLVNYAQRQIMARNTDFTVFCRHWLDSRVDRFAEKFGFTGMYNTFFQKKGSLLEPEKLSEKYDFKEAVTEEEFKKMAIFYHEKFEIGRSATWILNNIQEAYAKTHSYHYFQRDDEILMAGAQWRLLEPYYGRVGHSYLYGDSGQVDFVAMCHDFIRYLKNHAIMTGCDWFGLNCPLRWRRLEDLTVDYPRDLEAFYYVSQS